MKKFLLALALLFTGGPSYADEQVFPCFFTTANLLSCLVSGYSIVWPAHQGATGTSLVNDGFGNLTWALGNPGTVTNVTGTAPVNVASGTTTPVVSMHVADSTHDGYLAHTDWSTFNGKQAAISATTGSVFFSGGGSVVSQDNPNFFYNIGTHRLGLGTTAPGEALEILGGNQRLNTGFLEFDDAPAGNSVRISAPSTVTTYAMKWPGAQGGASTLLQNDGAGNLAWVTPAPGMAIGGPIANSPVSGSVLFVDGSGDLNQDNANFFYDQTNHKLALGTTTAGLRLSLGVGDAIRIGATTNLDVGGIDIIDNNGNSGGGTLKFYYARVNDGGTPRWQIKTGLALGMNLTTADFENITIGSAYNTIFGNATAINSVTEYARFTSTGNFGLGTSSPGAKLEIRDGHQKSTQTTAPTTTVNANAGTGATCTVANATDSAGDIMLNTGSASVATGAQCAVNFNAAYGVAPICVIASANGDTAAHTHIYSTATTSALTVNEASVLATLATYAWHYHCIETQ